MNSERPHSKHTESLGNTKKAGLLRFSLPEKWMQISESSWDSLLDPHFSHIFKSLSRIESTNTETLREIPLWSQSQHFCDVRHSVASACADVRVHRLGILFRYCGPTRPQCRHVFASQRVAGIRSGQIRIGQTFTQDYPCEIAAARSGLRGLVGAAAIHFGGPCPSQTVLVSHAEKRIDLQSLQRCLRHGYSL